MVCTPGLTLTLNKQSKISFSSESIWITWITAAYANMTSQINNDKLQRGYSQRTHNLWPAINFALICSLTQLIIFAEKGWEWRSASTFRKLLELNEFHDDEHLPMKEQILCCLSLHTAWRESSKSRHEQNNVTQIYVSSETTVKTPNMSTGRTKGVWTDELLRKKAWRPVTSTSAF